MHILEEEMSAGLSPATHKQSTVKMFPTYVRNTPNGTEIGQVLALDLGGTNFRVLLIDLRGNARVELTSKIFVIPQSIMIGDGKHVGRRFPSILARLADLSPLVISSSGRMPIRFYAKRESLTHGDLLSTR